MSKVLIIANGRYGQYFLKKISQDLVSQNTYHIATPSQNLRQFYKENSIAMDGMILFNISINPHSLEKIMNKHSYEHIVICLKTKIDTINAIEYIKKIDEKSKISFLNHWDNYSSEHSSITSINSYDILSNRLLNTVPNTLTSAENVGLGEGELVEVEVPKASNYIYRHISAINQRNFSISAIYRGKEIILPTKSSMIHPNDKLLVVGQPNILQNFYNSVNNIGSFTNSIKDIYVLIDMNKINTKEIFSIIKKAIRFYKKLELENILIKIINPAHIDILEKIKKLHTQYISIEIDFSNKVNLLAHIKKSKPSLIITNKDTFEKHKKVFNRSKTPILSSNNSNMPSFAFLIPASHNYIPYENISYSTFNFSSKMNLDINIYTAGINQRENNIANTQDIQDELIEHYQTISNLFKQKIKIIEEELNPIKNLKNSYKLTPHLPMQIIPMVRDVIYSNKITAPFMKNSDLLYYKLSAYDQLFLPI